MSVKLRYRKVYPNIRTLKIIVVTNGVHWTTHVLPTSYLNPEDYPLRVGFIRELKEPLVMSFKFCILIQNK